MRRTFIGSWLAAKHKFDPEHNILRPVFAGCFGNFPQRIWSLIATMNSHIFGAVFAAVAIAPRLLLSAPADQNWPQWRGPLANGVAPKADPPTSWSETSNVK